MKFLFGIALALGISAAAYGAAATLTVTGGALQQTSVSATCDADGVDIGFTVVDGFVTEAIVSDVNDNDVDEPLSCSGQTLSVELLGTGGANLDDPDCENEVVIAADDLDNSYTLDFNEDPSCEAVDVISTRVTIND
jgi:hypothetical protein